MSSSYISEVIPKNVRGRFTVSIGFIYAFGEIFTCFVSMFTLKNTHEGNWRALVFIVAQPALIGLIGIHFYLDESPRFKMVIEKNMDEAIHILQKIARKNGNDFIIQEEEKRKL